MISLSPLAKRVYAFPDGYGLRINKREKGKQLCKEEDEGPRRGGFRGGVARNIIDTCARTIHNIDTS